jgi:glycine dehydrogenase
MTTPRSFKLETDSFIRRHIGPSAEETRTMLDALGVSSVSDLIAQVVPESIRIPGTFSLTDFAAERTEPQALADLKAIASKNQIWRSFIGMGYYGCFTPAVIQRNILENPGWYTQYTPYQPEISQGRLEACLNFQTMITDLTGLPIANASLLDEGTAAAEAVALALAVCEKLEQEGARAVGPKRTLLVSSGCHPQTISVVETRARMLDVNVVISDHTTWLSGGALSSDVFCVLVQYPTTLGSIEDYRALGEGCAKGKALFVVAADILSLAMLTPPGEFGADIVVGSAQRFGVPMGFGGPHAAFFATKDEHKRLMPGRLVGVSKDSHGQPALRLSLQTREQHIRRERATSNICTAQVLLAVMASMYGVYHGPKGIRRIAARVHQMTRLLAAALEADGVTVKNGLFFDTLHVHLGRELRTVQERATKKRMNLRTVDGESVAVSLDETTLERDLKDLIEVLTGKTVETFHEAPQGRWVWPAFFERQSAYMTHEVFNRYHSETEFQRYVRRLESRDLSLTGSMIPLGSCTMKLNAATEMFPVTWPEFNGLHPFCPAEQRRGYEELFRGLESALAEVTGFAGVSLQPNAGSQGEYAGLAVIRAYHASRGESHRDICLIPRSAHGTNPASAVMAGLKVVPVECDEHGNIAVADVKAKALEHKANLAALMVTYPSTHGVFEELIREICDAIHAQGGQVYMDGANLNALVGVVRPNDIGADVCHINLHKTFCIPHGGGGPGMGPIAARAHLVPFLPNHPLVNLGHAHGVGPISAAPWGSASILTISWMYIAMMGAAGLREASEMAIVNANYIAAKLEKYYPVVYRGKNGFCAHECILDLRPLKKSAGIEVDDVAKRLMDYGFHAPTVSWPVAGTMMVEPTESESLAELDRFCEAMIAIWHEAKGIEEGVMDRVNNPLKNAPHTAHAVISSEWAHPYSREQAAFPSKFTRSYKFWPTVGRIDSSFGDRNLVCTCLPMEAYK